MNTRNPLGTPLRVLAIHKYIIMYTYIYIYCRRSLVRSRRRTIRSDLNYSVTVSNTLQIV